MKKGGGLGECAGGGGHRLHSHRKHTSLHVFISRTEDTVEPLLRLSPCGKNPNSLRLLISQIHTKNTAHEHGYTYICTQYSVSTCTYICMYMSINNQQHMEKCNTTPTYIHTYIFPKYPFFGFFVSPQRPHVHRRGCIENHISLLKVVHKIEGHPIQGPLAISLRL